MTSKSKPLRESPQIISLAADLPNLCSLTGLLSAVAAIYFAILQNFPAAMIGLTWALFFDWSDGMIARSMRSRTEEQRALGAQMDSLIDIISFGACPAIILLCYGNYSPWFIPGAFCILAAGTLRLSHFNVYGLGGEAAYQGLSIDSNAIFLTLLFLLDGVVSQPLFTALLYALIIGLALMNVAPIRTPKLSGRWYYGITALTMALTACYVLRLLQARN